MIDAVFPYGLSSVLAYLYYGGIPLAATWCVLSALKTRPRPGHVRRALYDYLTRDRRSYRDKCNRFRTDGPTPCYCCKGKCYAASDGET